MEKMDMQYFLPFSGALWTSEDPFIIPCLAFAVRNNIFFLLAGLAQTILFSLLKT